MPAPRTTPKGYERAHVLRKEMTPFERRLWSRLRNNQLGVSFRRSHALGKYIVDFCAVKRKLVIELDGSQHLEQREYDTERTEYLESEGYTVIRFWNNQVEQNLDGVVRAIMDALGEEIDPLPALPQMRHSRN